MRQNSWSISVERWITGTPGVAYRRRMGLWHTFQQTVFIIATFSSIFTATVSSMNVQQTPALNLRAGETAVMVCTFENKMRCNAKASWTRNSTGNTLVDPKNLQYSGRLTKSNLTRSIEGKAIMNISDVRVNDSDIYYCEIVMANENMVTIKQEKGNGTKLTVIEGQKGRRNQAEDNQVFKESSGLLCGILTPLAVIISALVISAILYLRKESSRQQLDAQNTAPMMAEMEESLHYAQINLRKTDQTAPLNDNTLYAPLHLPARVHAADTQKDNIHYAQLNLLQTEVNTT